MSDHEPFERDSVEDLQERLAAAVDRADRFHQALVEAETRCAPATVTMPPHMEFPFLGPRTIEVDSGTVIATYVLTRCAPATVTMPPHMEFPFLGPRTIEVDSGTVIATYVLDSVRRA